MSFNRALNDSFTMHSIPMSHETFISDLKEQRSNLDRLIIRLQAKPRLNQHDLEIYDAATRHIESRLRTWRRFFPKKILRNQSENKNEVATQQGGVA